MSQQISFVKDKEDALKGASTGALYSMNPRDKDALHKEIMKDAENVKDVLQERMENKSIYNRESDYHKRRLDRNADENDTAKDKMKKLTSDQKIKNESRLNKQEYNIPESTKDIQQSLMDQIPDIPYGHELRFFKESDKLHFATILDKDTSSELSDEDKLKRSLLILILRIKNGTMQARKFALKQLTTRCQDFGPKMIFDCILPILLDRTLEDQERHLMIKTMDRILFKLNDAVKPHAHDVLVIIAPLLIDEDPVARTMGNQIITNLASTTGLATMLTVMRSDIDSEDEYIRNITARAMAVVAKALSLPKLLPFLNAMCNSTKSWRIRHTGVKIIQQIALLFKSNVLKQLVELIQCIRNNLEDEHIPIRILTANTLSTLAQNSFPYGIEAFNIILEPLWKGIRHHRGKLLASFLRCIGSIIPLMDTEYAGYYTKDLLKIIKREFNSPDDEMKKTVLIVLQQCCKIDNVTSDYLRNDLGPIFFEKFWTRRIALDKQLNKMVTYTTVILSEKMGCSFVMENLLNPLRDEAEPFRIMAIHAINRVVKLLGTDELDNRLETRLIDGLLIAFQEQQNDDQIIFYGFATVVKSLDVRMKPFLAPIITTILNQLKHKEPIIRQNSADLCDIMIPIIQRCQENEMINKLSIILYESLGEVYPEVLGSIIRCISTIIDISNLKRLQPPLNQIVPTLTPILRNKHLKVQTSLIKLLGYVAIRGAAYVSPKEWIRICYELLETLKSPQKTILRATNDTFGYIARSLGPQDILVILLNNLKVQERQSRVSTAVAIGIIAETCGPYTVLPALMNEYRTPETNVQNGILKAMTFMLEYIGKLSQDYIYMITPLLEDALTDRDLVHRQTAATAIKHLALHCIGSGNEDAFIHMLNLLIPNIFETSPHVIARIIESIQSFCHVLGPGALLNYLWGGLFHPAKNVRQSYWKVYNGVYVQHVDAITPYYPIYDNSSMAIEEMDLVI